jgi:hypothetical protein
VVTDAGYGDTPTCLAGLDERQGVYVVGVSSPSAVSKSPLTCVWRFSWLPGFYAPTNNYILSGRLKFPQVGRMSLQGWTGEASTAPSGFTSGAGRHHCASEEPQAHLYHGASSPPAPSPWSGGRQAGFGALIELLVT